MQSQYADSLDMLRNSLKMLRLSLNTPRVSLQDTDINPDMQTQRLNMLRLSPGSVRLQQADICKNNPWLKLAVFVYIYCLTFINYGRKKFHNIGPVLYFSSFSLVH
jgi:hypothetical protein